MVLYKDGDKSRFRAHMANEHGAFFDIDYLLASCMMEEGQKETVARTVSSFYSVGNGYQDYTAPQMTSFTQQDQAQETLSEELTSQGQGESGWSDPTQGIKRERPDYLESDLGSSSTMSTTTEARTPTPTETTTSSSSKRRPKTISCPTCGKGFVSEQSCKIHVEKFHPEDAKKDKPEDEASKEGAEAISSANDIAGDVGLQAAEESTYFTDDNSFGGNDSASFQSMDGQDMSSLSQTEPAQEVTANVGEEQGEGDKATKTTGERFVCQFEGCEKSYTNASNRHTHQKKAHGWIGQRAAKKQKMSVSTAEEEEVTTTSSSEQLLGEEEQTAMETEPEPSLASEPTSSFLTDTSLGLDDPSETSDTETEPPVFTGDENPKKEAAMDISQSPYFIKNPKVIATARGKSLEWFSDLPDTSVLPSGWKQRIVEVTNKKTGDQTTTKHYLSPEHRVLRTGLAVIEYLRIKEGLSQEQLSGIASKLNVADKKFKELFSE